MDRVRANVDTSIVSGSTRSRSEASWKKRGLHRVHTKHRGMNNGREMSGWDSIACFQMMGSQERNTRANAMFVRQGTRKRSTKG